MENAEIDRLVMKPTARRRLGKYVLLGRIGHGGMGKIYLAFAPGPAGIEKLLVVKRLHSHLTSDPVLVTSFLDEARLSMALNHPNIVSTFDVGEVDGRYFMVMEYIDGQNLGVLLRTAKRSGEYPSSLLWAGVFLSVLDGLHAAHIAKDARGRPLQIIHRDVSPQNILVTYEGLPKIVDFGIAKAAMRVSETDAGVLKGKYAYMSPEQVRGDPLDARSDVFAAGIVLWEMLAGRRLYKADSIVRSVERILTEPPISPVRVNPDCDPEIARLAFKALQKDREQRFESALDLKEALEEVIRKAAKRTRQSDVRNLMHRLFGDVIEKQRAVLEACLSQGDAGSQPPIGVDDEDIESRASDSASDLSLAKLEGRSEVTTPSAIRGSPLVTGDSEHRANATSTSLERKRSKSSRLVVDQGASLEPPPRTPTAFDSPDATTSAPALHIPKRSPAVLVAAVVFAFAVLAFAVVVQPWFTSSDSSASATPTATTAPSTTASSTTAPSTTAPSTTAPSTPPSNTAPLTASLSSATTAPPTSAPLESLATPTTNANANANASATAKTNANANANAKTNANANADADASEPVAIESKRKRKVASVQREPDVERVEPKLEEARGELTLDTVPWTIVYLGKKKLGETPLNKVSVPAGALELVLVNAEQNIRETYIANVKAGAEYRARLDLN